MEADGFALPVIEAHCDVPSRRRGTTTSSRCARRGALLSPVRVEFDYEVVRPPTTRSLADRPHGARIARSATGRPCRLPERVRDMFSMP